MERNDRGRAALPLMLLALLAVTLAGLTLGPTRVYLPEALRDPGSAAGVILRHIRLPRVLTTLLAGAALGTSGALLQSVLHNPLASPGIIGVNAGAGLGATLCLALIPAAGAGMVSGAAFLGAVSATAMIYGIARQAGASRLAIVLAGVAMGTLFSAAVDALTILFPDCLASSNQFKIGSAAGASLRGLLPAAVVIPACVAASCAMHHELDLMALGDETAGSLGASPGKLRAVFLGLACALASSAVSMVGLIGFVGLLAPHMACLWAGGESGRVVPLSAVMGAVFLTGCDLAARTLFAPYELPVGILLSVLGAPFFLWLLIRRRTHD